MIKFFTTHRKVRGVITVFLTLIYLSTYLLICIFVDGGRVRMAQTVIEDVQQIATENVMSQYNRGLYEYYGLFGVSDYKIDDIAKDVKAQIEESIGLKIPQDDVKEFLLGVSSNVGLTKDNDVKVFDPYGIKVEDPKVDYIDLTNREVLRAQIRDEMRYTAPLVLGANFFTAVNQFMSVGDAADAVSNVAQTMKSMKEEVGNKEKAYYVSIDDFSASFHLFIQKTYSSGKLDWGKKEIPEEIVKAGKSIHDLLNNIISKVPFLNAIFKPIKDVEEKFIEVKTDMQIKLGGVLNAVADNYFLQIITNNVNNLSKYYDAFDNESGWPAGRKLDTEEWTDAQGMSHIRYYYGEISEEDHRKRAIAEAQDRKNDYISNVEQVISDCDEVIKKIDNTDKCLLEYKEMIESTEAKLLNFCESTNSEQAKKVYEDSMAIYLKQWNGLHTQSAYLENIKKNLENAKKALSEYTQETTTIVDNIGNNENFHESWDAPEKFDSMLKSKREDNKNDFHNEIVNLATTKAELGGIVALQKHADGEGNKNNIFKVLNTLVNLKSESGSEEFEKDALFGTIHAIEESNHEIYDPFEDDTISGRLSEYATLNDELNEDNVEDEVIKIMNVAGEIVSSALEAFAGNIYDETYILSHCRDYVHTYRYPKLVKDKTINENSKNIDAILNPKFIKDQSMIHYLDNEQFESIQVTPLEIEYILFGNPDENETDTRSCLVAAYASIFILRLALNYIAATTSFRSANECRAIAAASVFFAPAVRLAAPLIYAIPQSIYETKLIMFDCKEVNIWNGKRNLDLWEPYIKVLDYIVKDASSNIATDLRKAKEQLASNAKETLNNIVNDADNFITAHDILSKSPPKEIVAVVNHFDEETFKTLFKPVESNDVGTDDGDTSNTSDEEDPEDAKKVKAGYSDYLLLYLFLNGIDKKSQIKKLQNVIETNMNKVQDGFKLKDTYCQISIESNSFIKYIFMTQSLMKREFTNTKSYNGYKVNTKTAFAY